jgi:hypothetical protein
MRNLEGFFDGKDGNRDKFLARLFGVFSEQIVSLWCDTKTGPYDNLGRPTLKKPGEKRGSTLDFTFQERQTSRQIYVVELKCWPEYQDYKYKILKSMEQLAPIKKDKEAFRRFLSIAASAPGNPENPVYQVTAKRKEASARPVPVVHGAILVWGSVSDEGKKQVIQETGISRVLAMDEIIEDLRIKKIQQYEELLSKAERWCGELFFFLR